MDEFVIKNSNTLKTIHFGPPPYESTAFIPTEQLDLSLVTPQLNIEEVDIPSLVYQSDMILLYLIKEFPDLQTISISEQLEGFYEKEQLTVMLSHRKNFSLDAIAYFLSFVNKIPKHKVRRLFMTVNIVDLLSSY
jgi:hypothetical protein